jgi:hypothetical protein
MKIKIFLIILTFLFSGINSAFAKKIYCKKFSGKYQNWDFHVFFNDQGKMFVKADTSQKGWTSQPGKYIYRNKTLKVFIHSKERIFEFISKNILSATPYSFDIEKDYKSRIELKEDPNYQCK